MTSEPKAVGQGDLGIRPLKGLDLLDAVVRLLGPRLAPKRLAANLRQELGESRCPLANGRFRAVVRLLRQALDEPDEVGILGLPGESHVGQA